MPETDPDTPPDARKQASDTPIAADQPISAMRRGGMNRKMSSNCRAVLAEYVPV